MVIPYIATVAYTIRNLLSALSTWCCAGVDLRSLSWVCRSQQGPEPALPAIPFGAGAVAGGLLYCELLLFYRVCSEGRWVLDAYTTMRGLFEYFIVDAGKK